jgi:outer membrane protein
MSARFPLPLVLLWAALLPGWATAQEGLRIGHINSQQVLLLLPQRKTAEDKIRRKAEEIDGRIKAMMAEYESTMKKLQEEYAGMTPGEQARAQRDLKDLEGRIETAQERAEQDLQALQRELLEPMIRQVQDAVNEVAAAGGFAYILDISQQDVLYFDGGTDIMPQVKAKLGL